MLPSSLNKLKISCINLKVHKPLYYLNNLTLSDLMTNDLEYFSINGGLKSIDNLKENLTHLSINYAIVDQLKNILHVKKLPSTLKTLKINVQCSYSLDYIPNNLTKLIFGLGSYYDGELNNLPATLLVLILPITYEYSLLNLPNLHTLKTPHNIINFPSTLKKLKLYSSCKVNHNKLPLIDELDIPSELLQYYDIKQLEKLIIRNCDWYFDKVFNFNYVSYACKYPSYYMLNPVYKTFFTTAYEVNVNTYVRNNNFITAKINLYHNEEIVFHEGVIDLTISAHNAYIITPVSLINLKLYITGVATVILTHSLKKLIVHYSAKSYSPSQHVNQTGVVILPLLPNNLTYYKGKDRRIKAKFIKY